MLNTALPASGLGEDTATDHAEQCQTRVGAHTYKHPPYFACTIKEDLVHQCNFYHDVTYA